VRTASGNSASIGGGGGAVGGGALEGSGASISAKILGGGVTSGEASGGSGGFISVLPFTGGDLSFPLIAFGTPALAFAVLLVITARRIPELLRDWWHEKQLLS
jgi:hypothetical protein